MPATGSFISGSSSYTKNKRRRVRAVAACDVFLQPAIPVRTRQSQTRFTLARDAIQQPRVVQGLDIPQLRGDTMHRHVIVPDCNISGHVQVVVTKRWLQAVALESIEERPALDCVHALHLDRGPHTRPS